MLKLENKRLLACAEMMRESNLSAAERTAADIGTDHGFLAAYLVTEGICGRVYASDINPLPLESARRTVRENALENKIEVLLSDGLENLPEKGITDVICAGMGGELIIKIISSREWVKRTALILQPMTKADALRKWLFDNGFFVARENACRDGKFVYTIIKAEFAPQRIDYPCSQRYLALGRIGSDTADERDYICITAKRLRRAAQGMLKGQSDHKKVGELLELAEQLELEVKQ